MPTVTQQIDDDNVRHQMNVANVGNIRLLAARTK